MRFTVEFPASGRTVTPQPVFGDPSALDPDSKRPVRALTFAAPDSGRISIAQLGPTELVVQGPSRRRPWSAPAPVEESRRTFRAEVDGEVTKLALDGRAENLFMGTSQGQVVRYDMRDPASPARIEVTDVAAGRGVPVTALGFLIGDRTLVVGDQSGAVTTWQVVPPPAGGAPRLTRIYEFDRHKGRGARHQRIEARERLHDCRHDRRGAPQLRHLGPDLAVVEDGGRGAARRRDGAEGRWDRDLRRERARWGSGGWTTRTPRSPGGPSSARCGTRGTPSPTYVWQSTGGTDDFEAKFSLTPLIYGTLKGTFYALLVAVPLALLAAVYVSEFMHPNLKAYIKPVVEIMAALPSVVLGFLAGLWLAPMVERIVPGLFLIPAWCSRW